MREFGGGWSSSAGGVVVVVFTQYQQHIPLSLGKDTGNVSKGGGIVSDQLNGTFTLQMSSANTGVD